MAVAPTYNSLSLSWSPQNKHDHRFNLFATIVLSITLMIGFVFSSVKLPPQERKAYTPVPQRIAQFLTEKEKPKVVKPKPQPKTKPKPLPKPVQKPRIKKEAPNKALKNKPITKAMKKARKRAENSGLLALNNELADLMDTSAVSKMVSGRTTKGNTTAAKLSKDVLTKGTGVGSGGIRGKQNGMAVTTTTLSRNELNNFKQSLLAKNTVKKQPRKTTSSRASVRLEEQVTMIFDQNKSKLYSLYNRARRKNPGLKGKLILQITITAQGLVDRVKVIVSELNDSSLEQRIIARVKQFSFGPSGNETISVTFPIEFIPS